MQGSLVGYSYGRERDCLIVDVNYLKELDIELICPVDDMVAADPEEIGNGLYDILHDLIMELGQP